MRHPLRLLPLALLLALPVRGQTAGIEIVRVFTGWRDAASFQRISEFFDGRENTGKITLLRSQPGERAGFYWLVRLKNGGAPLPDARFELQVITPASPETRTFAFPTDIPAGRSVYRLGLTGADWPGAKARPVAWRLRLLAADGRTVVAKESFLWEMPAK
jgi:hypothetical protein